MLLTRGEPKLKKDIRFYRRTGMVSIYQKDEDRLEVPFDEFDPHLTHRTGPTGSTGFLLQLVHRYSDLLIQHINVYNHKNSRFIWNGSGCINSWIFPSPCRTG